MTSATDTLDDPQNETDKTPAPSGGEDESSTERDGEDGHLHDDQKSRSLET